MDEHTQPGAAEGAAGVASAGGLRARVDQNPYGSLAAALGVGYALGGGLFTPLTARLVRLGLSVGLRAALLPIVTERLSELVDGVVRSKKGQVNVAPEAPAAPDASQAAKI